MMLGVFAVGGLVGSGGAALVAGTVATTATVVRSAAQDDRMLDLVGLGRSAFPGCLPGLPDYLKLTFTAGSPGRPR